MARSDVHLKKPKCEVAECRKQQLCFGWYAFDVELQDGIVCVPVSFVFLTSEACIA